MPGASTPLIQPVAVKRVWALTATGTRRAAATKGARLGKSAIFINLFIVDLS